MSNGFFSLLHFTNQHWSLYCCLEQKLFCCKKVAKNSSDGLERTTNSVPASWQKPTQACQFQPSCRPNEPQGGALLHRHCSLWMISPAGGFGSEELRWTFTNLHKQFAVCLTPSQGPSSCKIVTNSFQSFNPHLMPPAK